MTEIDLRCQDVTDMLAGLPDECAACVIADPPWLYSGGQEAGHTGLAGHHYKGLPDKVIAAHLALTYRVAAPDSYLMVWATFPKLLEWAREDSILRSAGGQTAKGQSLGWEYVSGGAWGKVGTLGVGYHFRGDAELLLLYKKGNPKPIGGSKSNLWLAERTPVHSEKPAVALEALVSMGAPVGGLVVDCYAGESASLARVCRRRKLRYIGAEIDPNRHALALARLSQQEMPLEGVA